jgi:hypothetical protein
VIDQHVVADLGRLADHHAHAVVDEQPPADLRTGMDLDPGDEAVGMRHRARQHLEAGAIEGMRDAVHHHRLQAGIAGHGLEPAGPGWVTFADRAGELDDLQGGSPQASQGGTGSPFSRRNSGLNNLLW